MDVLELPRNVSDAYRTIATLELEAVSVNESGDENANNRTEQRLRFFYAAPNRMRYEPCGENAMIQVADGTHLHTTFGLHGVDGGMRFSSIPISAVHDLPHLFRPDFPLSNDATFIFQRIEERVVSGQILRQEDGCYVVAVTYERPRFSSVMIGRDILFWVNANTLMVMKQQGDLGHRFPGEDELRWTRITRSVLNMRRNEPLPEGTFHFTPPAGATEAATGGGGSGGTGFIEYGQNERQRLEYRGSHEWQGNTLVEHSKWKIRAMTLMFERRLTFSEDERELHVTERIKGPRGETEGSFKVPLK